MKQKNIIASTSHEGVEFVVAPVTKELKALIAKGRKALEKTGFDKVSVYYNVTWYEALECALPKAELKALEGALLAGDYADCSNVEEALQDGLDGKQSKEERRLRVDGAMLNITSTGFYFTCYPDDGSYRAESGKVYHSDFEEYLKQE